MLALTYLCSFAALAVAIPAGPLGSVTTPAAAGRYLGCATEPIENGLGRALLQASKRSATSMTLASCRSFCDSKGLYYSGVEFGGECYCGNQLANGAVVLADNSTCNVPCTGSRNYCGGANRLSLFASTKVKAATINFNGGVYLGCASDPNDFIRALDGPSYTDSNNMTLQSCRSFCDNNGYALSGTEYGSECYCGNAVKNGGQYYDNDDACYMACSGDSQEACGGPSTMAVFQSRLSRTVAATAGTPLGCFSDPNLLGRALNGSSYISANMTNENCRVYCDSEGYQYSGTEFSDQCFCGNMLINGGAQLPVNVSCSSPCAGNGFTDCGGPNLLSIYNKTETSSTLPNSVGPFTPRIKPSINYTASSYAYQGCYMEGGRGSPALADFTTSSELEMTIESCIADCNAQNYTYGGLEFSQNCFCGNILASAGAVADSQCSYSCSGDSTEYCGGPSRLSVYSMVSMAVSNSSTSANATSSGEVSTAPSNTTMRLAPKKFASGTGAGAQRAAALLHGAPASAAA